VHVGLEERDADLAQGILDVLLRELPAAAQALEDGIESCAQIIEHGSLRKTRKVPPFARRGTMWRVVSLAFERKA
jgi:hypothetical protein